MIAHRRGHNFQATGAKGYLSEVHECDKINNAINKYLNQINEQHVDCTPSNMSSSNDLKYGTNKANESNAKLFASIHMNASDSRGQGVEIWTYSDNLIQATNILKKLENIGYKNRGIKHNKNFHDLKATKMDAMIIEIGFVDNVNDYELYNRVGADEIGRLIAEGLTGKNIPKENNSTPKGGFYQVVTESYRDKNNAIIYQETLKSKGINSFLQYKEDK